MKRITMLVVGMLIMLLTGCSNDEKQVCTGKIVIETKCLEFRYLNVNGELVTFDKGDFILKMVGKRPVVCNMNGEVAEKYVGVKGCIRVVISENATFDCEKNGEVIYDGIRTHEEKKEYDYILKGWTQRIKYYESN